MPEPCGPVKRAVSGEPVAEQTPDGRAHEQLEGDHRAHRIPREPDPRLAAEQAEPNRGAGAHGDAPQLDLAAQLGQDLAHEVVLPHADPGGGDEQIRAPRGGGEALAQAFLCIAGQAQIHGNRGVPPDQRVQRVGIGGRNLLTREDLVRAVQVHDLVARSHEGDPRSIVNQRSRMRDGREYAELGGAQGRARAQHDVTLPDVLTPVADVLPGVPAVHHRDAPGLRGLGVLLPYDGVGAGRQRGPGEDACDLAGTDRLGREPAGGHGLDHRERDLPIGPGGLHVRGARRVAVHRGIVPGGEVDGARHGFGEHPVQRLA